MSSDRGARPEAAALNALPTGEVTFLFSDIEGSTQRWEAHATAMTAVVARHEHVVNEAIACRGGYVFKLMGDAFCAAFQSARDAIAAAIDAQRALARENFSSVNGLRVRIGLHTGHAEERNADYFGPAVNRVARLMSIGHGGQVLLSGATARAVHDVLPPGATLIDLGLRRLKDLTQPEQVWQLAIEGLPREFPPLNSLGARANNLPIQLTSLLGRAQDLDDVKAVVSSHRLLTLTGAGGIGKTRLALQAAADLIDRYADGVWFADLAPISDPELVASVVAKVVGMTQTEGSKIDEAIPRWLKRKHLLLILDNCEHVIEAAATLAAAILGAAPQVQIVATSRQALGIAGEVLYRSPSLALPETTAVLTAERASDFGAISLFVDRATASDARFVLSDDNAPIVADICRRLDGIPLAIELAAARVKVLSIPNLAQRLNERFKILTGGSRTALPRQKTLTALIDWSYDLLAPQEQTLFRRLSIFAGGFSLDAAAAVSGGDGLDESDILDLLSMLSDKSLVVADTSGKQERYRLLESTRAYALAKLVATGEHDRTTRRHAEKFRDQALAADFLRGTGSTSEWLAAMELDLDNYRAAMDWALTDGHDVALGAAVAGGLGWLWFVGGLSAEGRHWVDRAQAALDESAHPKETAGLWLARCRLSVGKGLYECAEHAVTLYGFTGDARGSAWALYYHAVGLFDMGRFDEASEMFGTALAAMRTLGDKRGEADCLNLQAGSQWNRGDITAARELYAHALEVNRALGDDDGTAIVLANLAELAFAAGHAVDAIRLMGEALEILTPGKNITHLATDNINMAAYRIALGDVDAAHVSAREGLRFARQAQYPLLIAIALQHLALLATQRRGMHTAALLVGYVDAQFRELGYERQPTEKWGYEKVTATLREQLSKAEIEKLAAEGASWSEERAVEEALKI